MNGAMETLVAQAYGAREIRLCGTILNRARVINTVLLIPLVIICCFARPILRGLGQDPLVVEEAYGYIIICLPGVWLQGLFDLKKRFLNCMTISWIPMLAMIGATVLHVLWCFLFVTWMDMSVIGLGLATSLTYLLMLVMITQYAQCVSRISDALFCFERDVFSGWGEYFKLGVPAMVMICAEDWAFQIMTFLAGIMGVKYQAAMVIIFQLMTLIYMV